MKIARLIAAIGAALLTCACLPVTTKTPVGSTVGFAEDPSLYGVWRNVEKDEAKTEFISFVKGENGTMTAITVSNDTGGGDWQVYRIKAANLAGHTFMNVREIEVNGKIADDELAGQDFLMLYTVKGNKLVIAMMDEKKVAAAIKAGTIAGTVEPGDYGDVHITADAYALDKFMQSPEGLALFGRPAITMKKVS